MIPAEKSAKQNRKPKTYCRVAWRSELFRIRKSWGLTLRQVAKGTGISISTLNRAERGADIYLSHATKIAKYFGLTILELWPPKLIKSK
jgi:transcriptional regulator with XRE-family HTH domain